MRIHTTPLFAAALALAALCATQVAAQQQMMIKQTGAEAQAVKNIVYREATDEYIVTSASGAATYQVARGKVESISMPKPSDFDRFAQGLRGGGSNPADVTGMESVVDAFKMLFWDVEGKKLLFPIYEKQNQWDKIIKMSEIYTKKNAPVPSSLQGYYWRALIKTGRNKQQLEAEIDRAIVSGSRAAAAAGYILKGDMRIQEGKKQEALQDGYFRAALMFTDIKEQQPEALYKVWRTLKDLNDTRAEKFRKKLLDEYGESSFAQGM